MNDWQTICGVVASADDDEDIRSAQVERNTGGLNIHNGTSVCLAFAMLQTG